MTGLRRDGALRQAARALQLRLDHGDLLLDLADALGDGGAVGLRHGLLDGGQDLAAPDDLAQPRQAALGRDDPAPVMLWTWPERLGSAITRPTRAMVLRASSVLVTWVRISSSRCVGFGAKTDPSARRRG